jgi:hypothetical protein
MVTVGRARRSAFSRLRGMSNYKALADAVGHKEMSIWTAGSSQELHAQNNLRSSGPLRVDLKFVVVNYLVHDDDSSD